MPNTEVSLKLSAEANQINKEWFELLEDLKQEELYLMSDFVSKLSGTTLRLTAILHFMEHGAKARKIKEVSKETMERAVELAKFYLEHAKIAYNPMGDNILLSNAKYVLERIKVKGLEQGKMDDFMTICKRIHNVKEMLPVFDLLKEHGYIQEQKQEFSGKGRPPKSIYLVNPSVLE